MAPTQTSSSSDSTQASDKSSVLSGLKIKLNFKSKPTSKRSASKSQPKGASKPPRACPFKTLGLGRNESHLPTVKDTISDILHMIKDAKKTGIPVKPSDKQITWATRLLRDTKRRLRHESKARDSKCECRTAWERLTDAQQAYLIKHADNRCHRVPEPSNPTYNSLDQDIPDQDYGIAWMNRMAIKEKYDPIWQKFDNNREADDDIPPCDCADCRF